MGEYLYIISILIMVEPLCVLSYFSDLLHWQSRPPLASLSLASNQRVLMYFSTWSSQFSSQYKKSHKLFTTLTNITQLWTAAITWQPQWPLTGPSLAFLSSGRHTYFCVTWYAICLAGSREQASDWDYHRLATLHVAAEPITHHYTITPLYTLQATSRHWVRST